ncbi:MAG: LysM peptidoglycan-binding domain-containing protein [Alphaproteobacteria bacterium]|nr:LysM peptidoglycan-binding domain-containing protein [Alphaproteobacteria bacterium]
MTTHGTHVPQATVEAPFGGADLRHSSSQTSDGSVPSAILRASLDAGLDPVAELYNEALDLARDGHYGQARSRLQLLLGLAPSDGDAHLLLAKVYVAGQQWRRAVATLDEAAQCGARVPEALREGVLRHLQADDDDDDERAARVVRDQGEVTKLRAEVRRLRSENGHLAGRNRSLEREAARWGMIATATSVIAIVLVLVQWALGVAPAGDEDAVEAPAEVATTAPAQLPGGDLVPQELPPIVAGVQDDVIVRDPGLAGEATEALQALGLDGVAVVVRGARASLSGTVPTHADQKAALAAVLELDGITDVSSDGVVNLARRDGATYAVASGDSLSRIAYRHYGDESLFTRIQDANPELGGGTALQIGQRLKIPPITD